jgi:hypothetical protein
VINLATSQRPGVWLVIAALILGICLLLAASMLATSLRTPASGIPTRFDQTSAASISADAATLSPALPPTGDFSTSINVAVGKPVIARAGGITYPAWGNANDQVDFNTTTQAEGGRWGHNTNGGSGTFEVVDLGAVHILNGVGYALDWDGAFQNPLTVQVDVSTDNERWTTVSKVVHRYFKEGPQHVIDLDVTIPAASIRYIRYALPPDGSWNGWGTLFQLRAYAQPGRP